MKLLIAMLTSFAAAPVCADSYKLICKNPRGDEYVVTYADGDSAIQASNRVDAPPYAVLGVEQTDEKHVVVAQSPRGSMSVRMNLRPYLRMEYLFDEQLIQTDACRLST